MWQKYERLCRSDKTSVRLIKERLSIVLLAAGGLNNGEIAELLPAITGWVECHGWAVPTLHIRKLPVFLSYMAQTEHCLEAYKDKELHVSVDNDSTHKQENVRNRLKRNKRVKLHFMPTRSSWLNLVEKLVGLITEKQIRRGVFSYSIQD